uniref:Uncharacterized protein LOC104240794 n=1 Tax=Nicotiana sylvestris TaxID=4096 RepID=A0A1U7XPJ1_NICSY|nr:PREDICTED: uncharacterized protein LOC104240794 [Nicotiana sylvestris]
MSSSPVLALPDLAKPFEVQIDASDCALGGVLLQEGHPVAYESRKLKDAERRYATHEKELLAVVHCLRLWRHYLLGTPFVVKRDNIAVSHFVTQPKLNGRQSRWQELLAEFHFNLEYRSGNTNHVGDALSRRADLASVCLLATLRGSEVATFIKDQIHDLLIKDPTAQYLVELVGHGKTRQFYKEDGFLKVKGNRLYVPKGEDLRRILLAECHDTLSTQQPPSASLTGPNPARRNSNNNSPKQPLVTPNPIKLAKISQRPPIQRVPV